MTGRPPYAPTDEQRRMVRAMAGFGAPQQDIAKVARCSDRTLRKWFREELDVAAIAANARVAQCLFQQATTPGNIGASIFWLKARAGWREKQVTPADDPGTLAQVIVIRRMFNPIGCTEQATEFSLPLIEGVSNDDPQ